MLQGPKFGFGKEGRKLTLWFVRRSWEELLSVAKSLALSNLPCLSPPPLPPIFSFHFPRNLEIGRERPTAAEDPWAQVSSGLT